MSAITGGPGDSYEARVEAGRALARRYAVGLTPTNRSRIYNALLAALAETLDDETARAVCDEAIFGVPFPPVRVRPPCSPSAGVLERIDDPDGVPGPGHHGGSRGWQDLSSCLIPTPVGRRGGRTSRRSS